MVLSVWEGQQKVLCSGCGVRWVLYSGGGIEVFYFGEWIICSEVEVIFPFFLVGFDVDGVEFLVVVDVFWGRSGGGSWGVEGDWDCDF